MTRLESAQAAMIEAKIHLGGHHRFEREGISWCFSSRPAGINVAWNPQLAEGSLTRVVEEILASARERRSCLDFLLFPSSTPTNLHLLLRREFRLMGPMYLPGMVLNLAQTLPTPGRPCRLRSNWKLLKGESHPLLRWTPKAQRNDWWLLHQQLAGEGCLHLWEAMHEGRPAACACSFLHEGHALITSVITEPDLRGLGFGASVMAACLDHAKRLGCDHAGLLTHKRAKAFYEKLGFQEEAMFSSLYFSKTRASL